MLLELVLSVCMPLKRRELRKLGEKILAADRIRGILVLQLSGEQL